jgi:hypothetical protein
MTAGQHACELHFITHNTQQQDVRFVVRIPTKLDPSNLDHLVSLQREDYMLPNADWNEIQNSNFSTTSS